jgi:choice-of-anchor B domain-containing protein
MKNKLLFISFLISLCLQAQTPCVGGFADVYPCNDYDLMAHIPVSTLANTLGNPEGSDIWGWTDSQTGKEYAIAAMTNSTAFVDITDPINPIFLGRLDTANGNTSFWRDVKVYQDHAFIVADNVNAHGMQVFDLTRLRGVTSPQTFTADTNYGAVSSCHNIVINEAKGVAYLVDCKNDGRGIHFVDISDPKTPFNIGNYNLDGVTHDAQVVTYSGPDTDYTNQEILIGSNENKVIILDVTDTSNVVKISEIDYPQLGYTHQGWFTEDQKYFLLGDETDEQNFGFNTRTLIFDFSDLDNPSLKSTYTGPTPAIDHNGYVKGNSFYLANYRAGLRVLDLTNIDLTINPITEVGFFDTYPSNDGTGFNGAWSVYPYFDSQNIIINDIESGLFIVRKSGLPLSVANETFNDRFSIFPNPASTNPVIKAKESELIQSVAVYNILGREIFSQDTINRSEFVLPVENQSKGIYIVKINQTLSKKLVLR